MRIRRTLTATALAALFTGGVFLGSGTASASTVLAKSCASAVVGSIGDQVALEGKDLSDIVKAGAEENEVFLHLNGVDPDKLAEAVTDKGALIVGTVPDAANGTVTGDTIATAVIQALDGTKSIGNFDWDKSRTVELITKKVAGNCSLNLYAGNYTPPTFTNPTMPNTPAPQTTVPSNPGLISVGTGSEIAPPRNYGNIPAAVPGVAVPPGVRYPTTGQLPGQQSPEIGVLGGSDTPSGRQPDVRNAGNADALAAPRSSNTVQLPMLLAVVALAGVSAALVRTWVLRKES